MKTYRWIAAFGISMLFASTVFSQTIRYVKQDATGTGTGSWDNASGSIEAMISASAPNDEIWIAAGDYTPATSSANGFVVKKGIRLYGGFRGNEATVAERNISGNETTLRGNGVSYHIVTVGDATVFDDIQVFIDGFSIVNGNANGSNSINGIDRNGGGGIFVYSNTLTVRNCIFRGNSAGFRGGAVYSTGNTNIYNSQFIQNSVSSNNGSGGAVYNNRANLNIANSLFISNATTGINSSGGAIGISPSAQNVNIVNSTFEGNRRPIGANAIFIGRSGATTIANSILWEGGNFDPINVAGGVTYTISHSLLRMSNPPANAGIVSTNPMFVNNANGDYRLSATSPAINAGSNAFYNAAAYGHADLADYNRVAESTIDMGAYEANSAALPVIFGAISATIRNNQLQVNWETEKETNNDHFEIEASKNGISFTTIATVATQAKEGNSTEPLQYSWQTDAGISAAIFLPALLMLLGWWPSFRQKKKVFVTAALLLSLGYISCQKNESLISENGKYFVRIVQVDKDGSSASSKTVQVINAYGE